MSKNIVFIIDIKRDGKTKKEYQYSIDSWKHFCKKYDHELLIMDAPVVDPNYMGVIWQRYFLFDILDSNEIDYDQILIVDADTIIHPDSPDVFELTDHILHVLSVNVIHHCYFHCFSTIEIILDFFFQQHEYCLLLSLL